MSAALRVPSALLLAAAALGARPLAAQNVSARVAEVRDGQVRFSVALRPGVCGEGQGIWHSGDARGRMTWGDRSARDVEYDVECSRGPGRVVLDKVNGELRELRFYVGGRWRPSRTATDLGTIAARDAAALLLGVARTATGKPARDAILPLTLVDSVEVWRDLVALARDEGRSRETRRQAVFWLGQLAEAPATRGLDEIVGESALDREVREQAVFALSLRPRDEGIPALVRIVRTNRDPALRRKALFWLGQSGDPRALQLIEELLATR